MKEEKAFCPPLGYLADFCFAKMKVTVFITAVGIQPLEVLGWEKKSLKWPPHRCFFLIKNTNL